MIRRNFLTLVTSATFAGCASNLSGRDRPVEVDCPRLLDDADSLCAHTGDPEMVLHPSSWQLADGADVSVKFTLSNDTGEMADVAAGPVLKRRVDDGWEHVWPNVAPPLDKQLGPRSSFSWEFTFSKDETEYDADERVELFELEQGTYAAVVDAKLADGLVQCVAPFEVGDGELL